MDAASRWGRLVRAGRADVKAQRAPWRADARTALRAPSPGAGQRGALRPGALLHGQLAMHPIKQVPCSAGSVLLYQHKACLDPAAFGARELPAAGETASPVVLAPGPAPLRWRGADK